MNFLTLLKEQMNDPRLGNRFSSEHVRVSSRALAQLIDAFERVDSLMRASHPSPSLHEQLARDIVAAFHANGKDGEITLLVVMDTLRPLIEDRLKEKQIQRLY